jgi:hypothetical protein
LSVIKRLITLLSACAREMADAGAARKQAEGAHRHLEGLLTNDPKVKFLLLKKKKFILIFRKLIHEKLLNHLAIQHDILIQKNMMLKLKNIKKVC